MDGYTNTIGDSGSVRTSRPEISAARTISSKLTLIEKSKDTMRLIHEPGRFVCQRCAFSKELG